MSNFASSWLICATLMLLFLADDNKMVASNNKIPTITLNFNNNHQQLVEHQILGTAMLMNEPPEKPQPHSNNNSKKSKAMIDKSSSNNNSQRQQMNGVKNHKNGAGLEHEHYQQELSYEDLFQRGYMPYFDDSEVKPGAAQRLKKIERCNVMMAEYIRKNKLLLTKSPPDLPVKVAVAFIVTNIYEVREKDQTVTLTTFIELAWRDTRLLKGTEDDCSDVSFTLANFADSIWFPLWTIENSADRNMYHDAWEKFPVIVHNRSLVTWTTSFRIVLDCPMNLQAFPFDAQNCYILIRSPHFFIENLQYYAYAPDQALLLWNENVSHSLWSLAGQMASRSVASNISGIEVWFRLERRPGFYIWTLILPTFLISLSTVMTFVLPSHSSEKLQTILTGILAYFILFVSLTEVTPQASENIPILTLFYVVVIAVGVVGSFACAIIVRRAQKEKANSLLVQSPSIVATQADDDDDVVLLRPHLPSFPSFGSNNRLKSLQQSAAPTNNTNRFTSAQLNDTVLYVYASALGATYVWLMAHTFSIRAQYIQQDALRFNYTKIQTF